MVVFDREKVKFKGNNTNLVEDKAENEYINTKLTEQDNVEQEPLYRDWETDRKSTRLNSSHSAKSRMPSSA